MGQSWWIKFAISVVLGKLILVGLEGALICAASACTIKIAGIGKSDVTHVICMLSEF